MSIAAACGQGRGGSKTQPGRIELWIREDSIHQKLESWRGGRMQPNGEALDTMDGTGAGDNLIRLRCEAHKAGKQLLLKAR